MFRPRLLASLKVAVATEPHISCLVLAYLALWNGRWDLSEANCVTTPVCSWTHLLGAYSLEAVAVIAAVATNAPLTESKLPTTVYDVHLQQQEALLGAIHAHHTDRLVLVGDELQAATTSWRKGMTFARNIPLLWSERFKPMGRTTAMMDPRAHHEVDDYFISNTLLTVLPVYRSIGKSRKVVETAWAGAAQCHYDNQWIVKLQGSPRLPPTFSLIGAATVGARAVLAFAVPMAESTAATGPSVVAALVLRWTDNSHSPQVDLVYYSLRSSSVRRISVADPLALPARYLSSGAHATFTRLLNEVVPTDAAQTAWLAYDLTPSTGDCPFKIERFPV